MGVEVAEVAVLHEDDHEIVEAAARRAHWTRAAIRPRILRSRGSRRIPLGHGCECDREEKAPCENDRQQSSYSGRFCFRSDHRGRVNRQHAPAASTLVEGIEGGRNPGRARKVGTRSDTAEMAFTSPSTEKRLANTYLSGTRRSEIEPKSGSEGAEDRPRQGSALRT